MLRIGLVAGVGKTIDAFFHEIVTAWRSEGHIVEIATGRDGPATFDGATVLPGLSRRPSPRNLESRRQLQNWVRSRAIDIVLTNTATSSFLVRAASVGVPIVYFCHGLHWQHPRQLRALPWVAAEQWALGRTSGVICLNSDDHEWFRQRIPDRLIRLERGVGLDLDKYPWTPRPAFEDTLQLVWIGEFSRRKRPIDAIDVVALLVMEGIDVQLTMLGDGALVDSVEKRVAQMGLQGRVTLLGSQPIQSHVARAHALLHTSVWEGLPRVGLECVAMGRPVLAYDTKGTRDIPGVLVAEGETPELLAKAVAAWVASDLPYSEVPRAPLSALYAADAILSFMIRIKSAGGS